MLLLNLTFVVGGSTLSGGMPFLFNKIISFKANFLLKRVVLLMFFLQVLSLIIKFIVIKDHLNDLHGIVPNLDNLLLGIFCSFVTFFFHFLDKSISILKTILFDIVLQTTKQLFRILNNFFERVSLIDIIEQR